MVRPRGYLAICCCLAMGLSWRGFADSGKAEIERLAALAPDLRPVVLKRALTALECAADTELAEAQILAVIDYSLPSTSPRLWVFDRQAHRLLFHTLVAHGAGTGENEARHFSNRHGSRQSSLGLFRAAETYHGRNGFSLRLDGLDSGINDQARSRAIVVHGAWYVSEAMVGQQGRLGRSWGCPALEPASARPIIEVLKEGGALFVSAEDAAWLAEVGRKSCPAGSASPAAPTGRGQ